VNWVRVKTSMLAAGLLLMARPDLDAQAPTAAAKFEVASIKLCQKNEPSSGGYSNPTRLHLVCVAF